MLGQAGFLRRYQSGAGKRQLYPLSRSSPTVATAGIISSSHALGTDRFGGGLAKRVSRAAWPYPLAAAPPRVPKVHPSPILRCSRPQAGRNKEQHRGTQVPARHTANPPVGKPLWLTCPQSLLVFGKASSSRSPAPALPVFCCRVTAGRLAESPGAPTRGVSAIP